MTRQERADYIDAALARLYPKVQPPLEHKDAYTLLIAVLLSAQCTDARVNTITPKLFSLADHPEAMRLCSITQIEEIIRPCGLSPKKSKAIHGLSDILMEEHDGQVPKELAALERLPGVGHKTASVVMAQAFGEPAFPVDTHIHRLAQRWALTNGQHVQQTEKDLKKTFSRKVLECLASTDHLLWSRILPSKSLLGADLSYM